MNRRLAAILAADVVGYSRLMEADETGTHEALKALRRDIVDPAIAERGGRLVKLMGDGALVEFPSAVDAVSCAIGLQEQLARRNARAPPARRIEFRIGVNLGDVIVEGDDIYGDGVNVACRLEGLAPPGGVCISEKVYQEIENKRGLAFKSVGEVTVRNIAKPVRTYRWVAGAGRAPKAPTIARLARRPVLAVAAVAVALVAGAVGVWLAPWQATEVTASAGRVAPALPDRPSLAVLPFDNLSADPEQEYFADGMTEDLITDLSKVSGLFVIARNSSFAYKGQSPDLRRVAEELGVRYVLEGSVRRAADRIRVNAQLIDATTGGHMWAERYDGTLDDVFALQDDLTRQIVTALAVELGPEDVERTRDGTENAEAYDAYLRGLIHFRRGTRDDYAKAKDYLEQALERDPDYPQALAALAALYWELYYRSWNVVVALDPVATRDRAKTYLDKALAEPTPLALQVSSKMLLWRGKWDEAVAEARKALALDTQNADSHVTLAENLVWIGSPEEALDLIARARRLDPHNEAYHAYVEGLAKFAMGWLEEAAFALERAIDLNRGHMAPAGPLAAAYGQLGRLAEARESLEAYCDHYGHCLDAQAQLLWFPFKREEDRRRLMQGFVQAGLKA